MSEENVQLGRDVMKALSARDLPRMISLAPAVEWHSFFAEVGEGGVYVGHEGTRRSVRDLDDAWEVVRADIDHELGAGDVVLFVGRIHYRGKGSGAESEDPAGRILKFRDGRLVHTFGRSGTRNGPSKSPGC